MEPLKKRAAIIILNYPTWGIPFAFLSMAIFRIPLFFNKNYSFWRLMGSGKSGTFDKTPDLRQWAILIVWNQLAHSNEAHWNDSNGGVSLHKLTGNFIAKWSQFFCSRYHGYILDPIEGHGLWNGKKVFGELPGSGTY